MIALRCKSQTKPLENSSTQNVANEITGKIIYNNHRDVKQSVCDPPCTMLGELNLK